MDLQRRDLLKSSPLAIAATTAIIERVALSKTPKPATIAINLTFNVRTYGAIAYGKTVDTASINQAILAVASADSGTLIFSAEIYLSFTVTFTAALIFTSRVGVRSSRWTYQR